MIWATNDLYGTRQVPIYYVDVLLCNGEPALGCYNPNTDEIRILESAAFQWASRGCTVRDHEIIHAFGYLAESEVAKISSCPNPNDESNLWGIYESDNIKHWDPSYRWEGYQ